MRPATWPSRDEPRTIVHGDFRADNLLFGPARPVVLDWQTASFGTGTSDLSYFLGSSLPVPVRQQHEEALVRAVSLHPQPPRRAADLGRLLARLPPPRLRGIIMDIIAAMVVQQTARGDEMFAAMASRHARHARDLDALALVSAAQHGPDQPIRRERPRHRRQQAPRCSLRSAMSSSTSRTRSTRCRRRSSGSPGSTTLSLIRAARQPPAAGAPDRLAGEPACPGIDAVALDTAGRTNLATLAHLAAAARLGSRAWHMGGERLGSWLRVAGGDGFPVRADRRP